MRWPAPWGLLLAGLLVPLGAPAQESTIEDEVSLLYSSQMQFGPEGIPQVTIGIMASKKKVSLSSPDGLSLSFAQEKMGHWEPKDIDIPPEKVLGLELSEAKPGKVTYWCGVESIPFGKRELLERALLTWEKRGETVQVFEGGSVFGIHGHVIDNRTYILGIRSFDSHGPADEAAAKVFTRYGTKTFVHSHLSRRPEGRIRVLGDSGKELGRALDLVRVKSRGPAPITVANVEYGMGYKWHGFQDRQYAGTILITLDPHGRLVVVNQVAVDRLLEGLVPAEIYPDAPMEALKAQAVVARGEVLAKIGTRHFLDPYLLCASTHCQVYAGVGKENPRTSQAVRATRGELLFLGPSLVDSVYSASCGGHTEDNDAVWSDPPARALRGRLDMPDLQGHEWIPIPERLQDWLKASPRAFCSLSTFNREGLFRWSRTITAEEMDRLVGKTKPVGQVVSIQVLARGVSGRVKVVRVVGTEGEVTVQREWPIRQLFGNLKSGMFDLRIETDEEQMPVAFHFVGGGWGHGVGMCQIGAIGMAEAGNDYRQILSHYYGGARVFRLYGKPPPSAEP